MLVSDFDYVLPPELIAIEPVRPRDASRMMVVNRTTGDCSHSLFRQLPSLLKAGDVLVINDTRVLRARIYGELVRANRTPRMVEVLFVAPVEDQTWEVMCRPGKHIRPEDTILFGNGVARGVVGAATSHGLRLLHVESTEPVEALLSRHGRVPLPPYIRRNDTEKDTLDYQTVFARTPGAIAAPTAGLHFTPEVLRDLKTRGVEVQTITLHVGAGTFLPIRTADPESHQLKPERFELSNEVAERLNIARQERRRIIAVGTTTTRTLEYVMGQHGNFVGTTGEADLFILPGHQFVAIDGLLTNFHLPQSTLLMLVCAFASRRVILDAYRAAVEGRYRFYSYGDCMLII